MVYAAEFIDRKNHRLLIDAMQILANRVDNFKVLLAGRGVLLEEIKSYVKECGLENHICFLGFVTNIEECYQVSDIALSSSKQEGLGINLVEAMMCGTPAVATVDRGHCTVIDHKLNGILYPQNDPKALAEAIYEIYKDDVLKLTISQEAIKKASKFEIKNSLSDMSKIYSNLLG